MNSPGGGIVNIISYWPASQRTRWYDAPIWLGETRTDTLDRFDLCYSFKMLCWAEYRENPLAPCHREKLHAQL